MAVHPVINKDFLFNSAGWHCNNAIAQLNGNEHGLPFGNQCALHESAPGNYAPTFDQVGELMAKARQNFQCKDLAAAVTACHQVLMLSPENIQALLLLGTLCLARKLYDQCLQYYDRVLQLNPCVAEAYSGIVNACLELCHFDKAMGCFHKALSLQPACFEAYMGVAAVCVAQGNIPGAVSTYRAALAVRPNAAILRADLGNLLKAQGWVQEAKCCYIEALQCDPDYAAGWFNLGHVHVEEGNLTNALQCFKKAAVLEPTNCDAWLNFANLAKEAKLYDQAFRGYQEVLKICSTHVQALCNVACLHYELGNVPATVEYFRLVLQIQPLSPDHYCSLGNALKDLNNVQESKESYLQALQLCPTHADSLNNLGNIYKDEGNVAQAMELYQKAIKARPGFPAAHSNLGCVYKEKHMLADALHHYHEALRANPAFADAYSNLGNTLKDFNMAGAIECYLRAIELKPSFADAHSNLACAYKDLGNIPEAIVYFYRALQIRPDFHDAFANLTHCYELVCFWENRSTRMKKLEEIVQHQLAVGRVPSVQPHHTMLYPFDPKLSLAIANAHGKACLAPLSANHISPFFSNSMPPKIKLGPGERLRIGYMSSDFGNHPTSHLMQSVPGFHRRDHVEVFCFALSGDDGSSYRKKIMTESEHFIDLSSVVDAVEAATSIYKLGIHILVNLNGYTKGARNEIFACKPAPIQVMWLGYPGSSGVSYMDYIITDEITSPPHLAHNYSEKLAYLTNTFFICDHAQSYPLLLDPACTSTPHFPTRKMYGLPDDKVVYCSFNQLYKVDETTFRVWCRILLRVPNSVLWLLHFPPAGEANLRKVAAKAGVPAHQLHFTSVAGKDEHIYRGKLADLFLDTPQCNAHTTGTDILWSGTPMITHPQDHFASRVAASLLHAIGCPELVCPTMQDYEDLAVSLGTDHQRLCNLKAKVEANRLTHPLYNTRHTVHDLELVYAALWHQYESGSPPEPMLRIPPATQILPLFAK